MTFITIVMFIWQFGFTSMAMAIWWSMYWILLIVGFVVGLLAANVSMWITGKILSFGKKITAQNNQSDENDATEDESK
ncbi:MAG: hypothetical protein J1G38_04960 [Clostridiales bacterium]|nr:hypothetical protein [Clostridiales bacterium]